MTTTEAADLIETMIGAIKANPGQFHISVKVIGQSVVSQGGIGMKVTAVGGGPGSTTIGNQVTVGGAQVQIAQQSATEAINQQFGALLEALQTIATALRSPSPDRTLIQRAVDSLKNTWVPGVISGVVANVVSKAIGL